MCSKPNALSSNLNSALLSMPSGAKARDREAAAGAPELVCLHQPEGRGGAVEAAESAWLIHGSGREGAVLFLLLTRAPVGCQMILLRMRLQGLPGVMSQGRASRERLGGHSYIPRGTGAPLSFLMLPLCCLGLLLLHPTCSWSPSAAGSCSHSSSHPCSHLTPVYRFTAAFARSGLGS